jgi:hypothetical protein
MIGLALINNSKKPSAFVKYTDSVMNSKLIFLLICAVVGVQPFKSTYSKKYIIESQNVEEANREWKVERTVKNEKCHAFWKRLCLKPYLPEK